MKLALALTGYIAVLAGLLFLWSRFIAFSQAPDDLPDQDTDSHSATGAGDFNSIHNGSL